MNENLDITSRQDLFSAHLRSTDRYY